MRSTRRNAPLQRAHRMLAAVCAVAMLTPAAVEAAGPALSAPPTEAPVIEVGPHEQAVARRLDLSIGRSVIVDLPRDAKEVFVANPKVANAVVRSTRKVFVIGMENGATSIFVMDAAGRQIAALEVAVGRDLNVLRQTLRSVMPQVQIDIKPAGDSIVLTGNVNSASEAQQAVDIASAFVGVGGAGVAARGAVINGMIIRGKDQVMLKVTIAEVQRQVLKELGVNLSASNWTIGKSLFLADTLASGGAAGGTFLSGLFEPNGPGRDSTAATLRALERNGVMRLLAEPTLVAISGESAKFLAGGEIPYASGESFDDVTNRRSITFTYRPIGVSLNFTPVVLAEGRISLRIFTEVSELDRETALPLSGTLSVPGIKMRRTETTVEVPSGGSLVSAGLIQQSSRQIISGTPALKNLPVLGALFRSREYQRQETELMIVVTPYIAKPIDPGQIARPDDGFVDSHDGQAILLGRLNRMYGVVGAKLPTSGYRGPFGFITD